MPQHKILRAISIELDVRRSNFIIGKNCRYKSIAELKMWKEVHDAISGPSLEARGTFKKDSQKNAYIEFEELNRPGRFVNLQKVPSNFGATIKVKIIGFDLTQLCYLVEPITK